MDRMYVTAMPTIATLTMAENYIKTNRIGLGCGCKQNVGISRGKYHKHDPAPLSLYNWSTTASQYISDHQNHGRKNQENDG